MSKGKTCGECRYYEHPAGQCAKVIEYNNCHITDKACEYFEPKVITKGDRIRSMSNEEFSNFICKNLRAVIRKPEVVGDNYEQILLAWLNSPAESEGER